MYKLSETKEMGRIAGIFLKCLSSVVVIIDLSDFRRKPTFVQVLVARSWYFHNSMLTFAEKTY